MDGTVQIFNKSELIAEGEFIIPAEKAIIKSGDINMIHVDVNVNTFNNELFPSEFIPLSLQEILPALSDIKAILEITTIQANGKKGIIKKNIESINLKFNRYWNMK